MVPIVMVTGVLVLAGLCLARFAALQWWWFSPLLSQTDEDFAAEMRQLGMTLPAEQLLRYRRQVASAMGVPRKHILGGAPLALYERFASLVLAVHPSDVLDDVTASLARLDRRNEELPKTIVEVIRLFAEDDDQRKSALPSS